MNSHQTKSIMLVTCTERDGVFVRLVKELDRSAGHILVVADRLRQVRNCFQDKEFEGLVSQDTVILEIDNVGITVLDSMDTLEKGGRVHITFWDRKLKGRELLCRRIAERWLDEFGLDFLCAPIPKSYRAVLAFCKRVGFVVCGEEGDNVKMTLFSKDYLHRANSAEGRI